MKHKLFILLIVAALVLSVFTACGSSAKTGSADKESASEEDEGYDDDALVDVADEDRLNIGISLPKETEYNKKLAKELTNRLWRKGFNVILKYAENDTDTQQEQISELLLQDIKCLIVYPVKETGLDLSEVSSAEVPIINIELPLKSPAPFDIYVGFDNVAAGEKIADYIITKKRISTNMDVTVEMLFNQNDPLQRDIYKGIMNLMSQYFDDGTLVCRSGRTAFEECSTTAENAVAAYNDLERILSGYYLDNDLEILISGADYIASGAAAHFYSQGYQLENMPMITGVNGEPSAVREFENGLLSMTAFKNTREEALLCAKAAVFLTTGEDMKGFSEETINNGEKDVPWVILEPEMITQENYIESLINSNYYSDDEIYG